MKVKETKKARIQIGKSRYGWKLSLMEGDMEILDELYGEDYSRSSEKDKGFYAKEPIEKAMEHVIFVANSKKMTIEDETKQTITLSKVYYPEPIDFDIDLKWSLWDKYECTWEDYEHERGKEIYQKIREAFEGTGAPVKINTAPRKEIRFGNIEIYEGGATVEFHTHWDEPYCHIPESIPDDEEIQNEFEKAISDYFDNMCGFCEGDYEDPIGAEVGGKIKANTFEELMEKIDNLESELLEMENANAESFKEFISETTKAYQDKSEQAQPTENSDN